MWCEKHGRTPGYYNQHDTCGDDPICEDCLEEMVAKLQSAELENGRLTALMYREAPCMGKPNTYVEHTFEGEPTIIDDDRCFTGGDEPEAPRCPWNRGDRCEVSKLEHLNPETCPMCGRSDPHVHEVP